MPLSDEEFNLIQQLIALVRIMAIVIMKPAKLGRVPPGNILSNRRWLSKWSIRLCGLVYFCSRIYQGRIIGELGLVLNVLLPFIVQVHRFLRPFPFVIVFVAASSILA